MTNKKAACAVYQDENNNQCSLPVFGMLRCPVWTSKKSSEDRPLTPDSFIDDWYCKKHYIKVLSGNWYEQEA